VSPFETCFNLVTLCVLKLMLTIIYHLVKFESNTSEFLYKYHVMLID